jgi:tRNA-2-methylthio-N6-dimethylallyladenosine synthase
VPDLALSTDVIVGYPGETEQDFQATVDLVDEVGFDSLFVFMYSARPGTTALRLVDDVPEAEKLRRLQLLNGHQQRLQAIRNQERMGSREEVLVESVDGPGRVSGRTRHFRKVHVDAPEESVGALVQVEVTGSGPNALMGRLIEPTDSLTGASGVPIL